MRMLRHGTAAQRTRCRVLRTRCSFPKPKSPPCTPRRRKPSVARANRWSFLADKQCSSRCDRIHLAHFDRAAILKVRTIATLVDGLVVAGRLDEVVAPENLFCLAVRAVGNARLSDLAGTEVLPVRGVVVEQKHVLWH